MTVGKELSILISGSDRASPALQQLQKDLTAVGNQTGQTGKSADQASSSFANMAKAGAGMALGVVGVASLGVAVAKVGEFAIGSVKAASDLNETVNKSAVIFGSAQAGILQFAEGSAQSMGQSRQQAIEMTATFGNLFKTMGLGQGNVVQFSEGMVKLGADLASFHNIPVDVALEKLRSGLVGEAEPMRQLGVLLDEATVASKAMAMGLGESAESLSQAAKVQARYAIIMEQTKDAQGDFARTSDGLANSTRILDASMKDLSSRVGDKLLPAAQGGIKLLLSLGDTVGQLGDALGETGTQLDIVAKLLDPTTTSAAANAGAQIGLLSAHANASAGSFSKWAVEIANARAQLVNMPRDPNREKDLSTLKEFVDKQKESADLAKAASGAQVPGAMRLPDSATGEAAALRREEIGRKSAENLKKWREEEYVENQAAAVGLGDLWQKVDDKREKAIKDAEAAAKKFASAGESAAKRVATAIENTTERAEDLAYRMDGEVARALADVARGAEEAGERWIEKWFDVDAAIQSAQRSAENALRAMDEQEAISGNAAIRRKNLNERLSDEDYHHREEKNKAAALRRYQQELNRASNGEERKAAEQRYNDELENLRQAHMDYDEEVRWRMYLEGERARLESELHKEEMDRRRAAIEAEKETKITAINTEWDEWQASESKKTTQAATEAKQRAKDSLSAWSTEFYRKLPEEAAAAADQIKAIVEAALGAGLADLGGGGGGGEGGNGYSGGEYVDPSHQPGGEAFEAWKAGNPSEYEAWANEHGIPSMAQGGIVPGPIGAPQLILAHGGEPVGPAATGGTSVNVYVSGSVVTERDLVRSIREGLLDLGRSNISVGLG